MDIQPVRSQLRQAILQSAQSLQTYLAAFAMDIRGRLKLPEQSVVVSTSPRIDRRTTVLTLRMDVVVRSADVSVEDVEEVMKRHELQAKYSQEDAAVLARVEISVLVDPLAALLFKVEV